jgi:hypothetical protein
VTGDRTGHAQRAIDYLSKLDADDVDWSCLPASIDYGAICAMARRKGVDTNETALREAFALIMRARVISSLGTGASRDGGGRAPRFAKVKSSP